MNIKSKKDLKKVLNRKNNKKTLEIIEKNIDSFNERNINEQKEIKEKKELIFDLKLLDEETLKTDIKLLESQIEECERINQKWVQKTLKELKIKRLEVIREIRKKEIEKIKKELKEKHNSGK